MAAYVTTRQRTLRGMGATYSFVPRIRSLRGLGDDTTDIDVVTGLPCDDPRANCGPAPPDIGQPVFPGLPPIGPAPQPAPPPFVFTNPKPIIPPQKIVPVTAPVFGPLPGGVQVVFPSQGTLPTPAKFAAPAATASWFDQQMIAGVPNSYLALGTVGLVLFLSISSAKRRR